MCPSLKREFLDLITIDEAHELIKQNFSWNPSIEVIPLNLSKGRILAENITAKIDSPPFDRSLMDGFAVRAEDTFDIDETHFKKFQIIDSVPAGKISNFSLSSPFTCIEISTGAPIPQGANAVVMVEYSSKVTDKEVTIFRSVRPHENIDPAGSDIMYGETLLRKGDILDSVRLGILASLGISSVKVFTKIRVGILSSGDELRKPGEHLPMGCLYDSNSIVLSMLTEESGADPVYLGICPDDLEILKKTIIDHINNFDIFLISGGTSAGEGDYSYRVIKELGGKLLFHGVSMKPGKPLAVGLIKNKLFFTVPGFPASAIFSFNTVIAPLFREWTRTSVLPGSTIEAVINQKLRCSLGRTQFKLVHVMKKGNSYTAYPVKGTSGSMSMLERADGFIVIPEDVDFINPGDHVVVNLFGNKLFLPDIVFIGSHDIMIDLLFQEFMSNYSEYTVKLIFTGSTGGLSSMSKEECDIAGIHLLDTKTQQYNHSYIEQWMLKEKTKLIKGYKRKQGLYVKKGNPKEISGIDDLFRDDITFLNRNEGSGTRILIDNLISNLTDQKNQSFQSLIEKIKGYSSIAYSHSATASAVARNKVDVSIGIEPYANLFGIEFSLLAEEDYDFLVKNTSLEKPAIKKLVKLFYSEEFRRIVESKIPKIKWFPTNKKLTQE